MIRRPKFYVQGTAGTIEGRYRPLVAETVEPGRGYAEHHDHHAEAPVTFTSPGISVPDGSSRKSFRRPPTPAGRSTATWRTTCCWASRSPCHPRESRDVVAVLEAAHRSAAAGGILVELG